MRIVYASIVVEGKRVRKPIILEDRNCTICNKVFSPKRQSSKECSRECQKKAEQKRNAETYNARAKKYYKDNRELIKEKRKSYYWKNPEKWKAKSREWSANNREKKIEANRIYKDRTRHGNKREQLVKEEGLVCNRCGKKGDRFAITAHHSTFNKKDHAFQELLCRSCHAKIHAPKRQRDKNGQKFK